MEILHQRKEKTRQMHKAGEWLSGRGSSCKCHNLSVLSRIRRKILYLGGPDCKPGSEKAETSGSLELIGCPTSVSSRPIRDPVLSSGGRGKSKREKKESGEKRGERRGEEEEGEGGGESK